MNIQRWLLAWVVLGAFLSAGCKSETAYNIPEDPAKESAAIKQGAPAARYSVGRRKVTKPPGGAGPKDGRNLSPTE